MSYTLKYTGAEIDDILDRAAPSGALDAAIAAKQDALTFDDAPTEGSDNPVKSGGIYDAIQAGGATALGAYPTDTITDADIASFSDGADDVPVKSFTGSILPVQSGSGDPSPSNIRPISGWTGAEIYRRGINLWDEEWEVGGYNISNGEKTVDSTRIRCANPIPVVDGESYYALFPSGASAYRLYYDNTGAYVGNSGSSIGSGVFTVPSGVRYITFYMNAGYGTTYGDNISINYLATDTTYHAYDGQTILLTFGQTVYAGTLTALGGGMWKIQPTHAIYTVTGAEAEWAANSAPDVQLNSNVLAGRKAGGVRIVGSCSMSPTNSNGNLDTNVIRANSSTGNFLICKGVIGATTWGQSFTNLAAWKTWLATQYTNGTPLQVCYELAEASRPDPITVNASDLVTLLGSNNVWTDCGSIAELTYRADTALYIQKLINGGALSTLSMASPTPALTLDRPDTLTLGDFVSFPSASEPEVVVDELAEEQTGEPTITEDAEPDLAPSEEEGAEE